LNGISAPANPESGYVLEIWPSLDPVRLLAGFGRLGGLDSSEAAVNYSIAADLSSGVFTILVVIYYLINSLSL